MNKTPSRIPLSKHKSSDLNHNYEQSHPVSLNPRHKSKQQYQKPLLLLSM